MINYKKKYFKYKEKYLKLKGGSSYDSDDELNRAIAMSLNEPQNNNNSDDELNKAIAMSLAKSQNNNDSDDEFNAPQNNNDSDDEFNAAIAMSLNEPQKDYDLPIELPYLKNFYPFLINEVKDGNCLFRAFSRKLYGNDKGFDLVRTNICKYLLNNIDLWKDFTTEASYSYIELMLNDKTWGGHIEIMTFRNLYGCTIVVHDPPSPPVTEEPNNIYENNFGEKPEDFVVDGKRLLEGQILHLFRKDNHYQTLKFNSSDYIKAFKPNPLNKKM